MRSKLEVKMCLANLKRVGLWTLTLSIRLPAILVLRDWELLYIELGGNEMHRDDDDAFECERGRVGTWTSKLHARAWFYYSAIGDTYLGAWSF